MTNYQRQIHLLTVIVGLTLLTSCKKKNGADSVDTTPSVADSIKKSDLIEWKDLGDPLKIVTTDDIGYFPFGKLSSSHETSQYFEGYIWARTSSNRFYVANSRNKAEFDSRNKIEFYEDSELNVYQIVKGEINEPDLMLVNNFHVGTHVRDILKYFRIRSPKKRSKYSVVIVETGITGMTHFYQIHNSKIQKIRFKTDFEFVDDKSWPFSPT